MSRAVQLGLGLKERSGHGGARVGAGRPRIRAAEVAHRARPKHVARHPVHATLRLVRGLPSLRQSRVFQQIRASFKISRKRDGFRLIHYSVQANHLHLIVEADDRVKLMYGLRALQISIAHRLNRCFGRRGKLFADRYHARALKTPREVRHALSYVLLNWNHHAHERGLPSRMFGFDRFASSAGCDGWRTGVPPPDPELKDCVHSPSSWLMSVGHHSPY